MLAAAMAAVAVSVWMGDNAFLVMSAKCSAVGLPAEYHPGIDWLFLALPISLAHALLCLIGVLLSAKRSQYAGAATATCVVSGLGVVSVFWWLSACG